MINVASVPAPWTVATPLGAVWAIPRAEWEALIEQPDEPELTTAAKQAGLERAEAIIDVGDPVERIVAAADEHDVDVIVVGSHDKGFLTRLFDPSVSEGVLRLAHRPVLVVGEETHT